MNIIISGDNIVKAFGEGSEKRNVLDGVSLEINAGDFISVMGPSGSGKTTLLFALSGMDEVDSGKVIFDGLNLAELSENELANNRRTKMGFVFQQPTLIRNLNIIDNIILPAMRDNRKRLDKITEKARTLMQKTNIEGLEKRDITQVSGGQLQRAGICRALMSDPKIIFGDEPTGALNSQASQEIMNIFSEINAEGTTVMFVTHDAKVAAQTDRILFMLDGKIESELNLPKYKGNGIEPRVEMVIEKMREVGI